LRPTLPHPLRERRGPRARQRLRLAARVQRARRRAEPLIANPALSDPAVARVREAGGPIDRACYTCQCGYLFVATVSTTVNCPHCGAGQAW
jgi:hypothetical protein